jgi:beta-N-acetylhexosaminidase
MAYRLWGRLAAGLAAGALSVLLVGGGMAAAEEYTDLGGVRWASDSIDYLSGRGTIAGYGNGIYAPGDKVTRAQATTFLIRELSGRSDDTAAVDGRHEAIVEYSDVPRAHLFYGEITAAAGMGLAGGFPDGTFRPDAPISRAETMALLTRAYALQAGSQDRPFPDAKTHWASAPIAIMASNGLIGGYGDGAFRPNQPVTRAEFAVFLARVIRFGRESAIAAQDWDKLLTYMTLSEKAGQMLMPDIRQWRGKPTTAVHEGVKQAIGEQDLGGLILFDKNIVDAGQLTTLTHDLQQAAGDIPLFLGIDQEGGVVKRIPGGTNLPGQMALGATRDAALAREAGKLTGEELKALGVQMNFAPVLDVNSNPDNPIIGIRSFGSDPEWVSRLGLAAMQGLREAGVIPAVKHFPGHGDTMMDSHLGLPILPHDRERLEQTELKPFRAAIENGAEMIMSAHIAFPAIDSGQLVSRKDGTRMPVPATLSHRVMTGLLREELGFEGVVISDAFTMEAIAAHVGEERAVQLAVSAGVDIILMPQDPAAAHRTLVEAVKQGKISEQTLDASVERILKLKQRYGMFKPDGNSLSAKLAEAKRVIGSRQHRLLEQRIAERAVTLLAGQDGKLPRTIQQGDSVLILAATEEQAEQAEGALAAAHDGPIESAALEQGKAASAIASAADGDYDYVILASYQFRNQASLFGWPAYQAVIDAMNEKHVPYTLLSMGNPYELLHLQRVKAAIAVYGKQEPNLAAGMKTMLGRLTPLGTLPVS